MQKTHILIVDDDQEIREMLSDYWQKQNFQVSSAADGNEMFAAIKTAPIDIIILDVMLPGTDGLELCRQIRMEHDIPILMLSAAATESDRIVGIEIGADDYLVKPFSMRELHARVKALLRREKGHIKRRVKEAATTINFQFAHWTLDTNKRFLINTENDIIKLSAGEYDLLMVFISHNHKTLTRDVLLDFTCREGDERFDRTIDSQVRRLRKKLEHNPKQPEIIKTVRGGGYSFDCDVTEVEVPLKS